MEKQNFLFLLNEADSLTMELHIPLDKVDCCYEESIVFIYNKKKIILCHQAVKDSMYALSIVLKKALEKDLFLHNSIKYDIGYSYNEYSYYLCAGNSIIKDTFFCEMLENSSIWVGMRYYLWAGNDLVSWLYNDHEGAIIFEVTPFYPYMYPGAEEELNYISYEKWIKNYKPYFIRTISRETAEEWLEKAHFIVEQIDKNIARWNAQK